jgi:hypothetical protein
MNNVRFKIFKAVSILMMFFWVTLHVDWLVEAKISEMLTVFIFRVEDGDSMFL